MPRARALLWTLVLALTLALAPSPGLAQSAYGPDLSISKSAPRRVATRQIFAYDMFYHHSGPGVATGVQIVDQLPPGVRFSPFKSDANCSESGGVVTCNVGTLGPNAIGIVHLAVWAEQPGTLTNTAEIRSNELDPNPTNNTSSATTEVYEPAEADIQLVSMRNAYPQPTYLGEEAAFWLEVSNQYGPGHAHDVVIRYPLPDSFLFVPERSDSVCVEADRVVTCSLGTVLHMTMGYLFVSVRPTAVGTFTSTASITTSSPDPRPDNNTASTTTTVVPHADLAVSQTESADPARPGQPLAYTVTVTNNGPSTATGVTLADAWSGTSPGGVTLLSFSTSQGTCAQDAAASIACQLGALAPGASATIVLTLQPRGPGEVRNSASAAATEPDRREANNSAVEVTTVSGAG
jgi:uncharacterized repeat protein (TIGR01451 family)